jgi:amidase
MTPSLFENTSNRTKKGSLTPIACHIFFPQAQHSVSKEHFQYKFGVEYEPVVTVAPGDFIHVETNDCYHGRIHPGLKDPSNVVDQIKGTETNPITGPIYVTGAMPGDILAVTLLDIQPQGVGVACCGSSCGQLSHWTPQTTTKFFDLSDDGTIITMKDTVVASSATNHYPQQQQQQLHRRRAPIAFPAKPMLGVIGVAPAGSKPIPTMPAGKHGGNLDNNCNGIGSTIYFPVNHPGALLSMGDMHAAQGDGEISGNGVEIGGHVLLQCRVIPQKEAYTVDDDFFQSQHGVHISLTLEYPVTETATHWITHGVVEDDIPQTTTVACEEAAKLLVGQWGFTIEEAFIFLSVQGNLGLCQSCHPDEGTQIAKMTVPKLPACPRPFRVLYENEAKTTTSSSSS